MTPPQSLRDSFLGQVESCPRAPFARQMRSLTANAAHSALCCAREMRLRPSRGRQVTCPPLEGWVARTKRATEGVALVHTTPPQSRLTPRQPSHAGRPPRSGIVRAANALTHRKRPSRGAPSGTLSFALLYIITQNRGKVNKRATNFDKNCSQSDCTVTYSPLSADWKVIQKPDPSEKGEAGTKQACSMPAGGVSPSASVATQR